MKVHIGIELVTDRKGCKICGIVIYRIRGRQNT